MKFNWGTGITVAIIVFMGFILFMVFKMTGTDSDLYAKDYYNQEIGYQAKIDAKNNTNKLRGNFDIQMNEKSLVINFPEDFQGNKTEGKIHLYRPNNADRDAEYSINLVENSQSIDLEGILQGHYDLKIECQQNGTNFFFEKPIVIR